MGSSPDSAAKNRVFIRGLSVLSADTAMGPFEQTERFEETLGGRAVFPLSYAAEADVAAIAEVSTFAKLDRTTHLALACARKTKQRAEEHYSAVGCVSIGSSRGPTVSIEKTLGELHGSTGRVSPLTSPITTAGNLSSWVAQDLLTEGGGASGPLMASLSTSMTCSSAFQSLIVSYAMLQSGLAETALFGGSEACLTTYTMAQLDALRIYSPIREETPCRPCATSLDAANTVVLGEAAGTAFLVGDSAPRVPGDLELLAMGWAMERIPSPTGISEDGQAFEAAMRAAVARLPQGVVVDGAILHAPGTVRGDQAEQAAVRRVLGDVETYSTKHRTGHTYGASGMVSLDLAQHLLTGTVWRGVSYASSLSSLGSRPPRVIAINTAGFGGNAVTVIVRVPSE